MRHRKDVVLQEAVQHHHKLLLTKKDIVGKILDNLGYQQQPSAKGRLILKINRLRWYDGRADESVRFLRKLFSAATISYRKKRKPPTAEYLLSTHWDDLPKTLAPEAILWLPYSHPISNMRANFSTQSGDLVSVMYTSAESVAYGGSILADEVMTSRNIWAILFILLRLSSISDSFVFDESSSNPLSSG